MSDEFKILRNYFIYFIFLIITCFIGISDVFGITFENFQYIEAKTILYVGYDNNPNPINWPYNNSGLYQNNVVRMDYVIDNQSFLANVHYEFESHMLAERFIGNPSYTVSGLNGESCKTDNYYLNFINTEYPRWDFECPHATTSLTITIFQLDNSKLFNAGYMGWGSAILSQTSVPIESTTNDTNEIINNQNRNTQDIIDNQNQNTQDIIDNQNQNTQDIIDSQKVCKYYDKSSIVLEKKNLSYNGTVINHNNYGITDYISLNSNSELRIFIGSGYSGYMCFYDINKVVISCLSYADMPVNTTTGTLLTIPVNASYFRAPINYNYNRPTFNLCKNGNDALTGSIDSLNDTLNDDDSSGASTEASEFFSSFTTNTFGLTSIITAPLNLIQSLTSSTCSSLHLPLPYLDNKYLDLPCMSSIYSQYFGNFFTIYQTITYGIIAYWVCVRIFNLVKDFKNPEHDEIEVVDL